jgi:hypothetical protein
VRGSSAHEKDIGKAGSNKPMCRAHDGHRRCHGTLPSGLRPALLGLGVGAVLAEREADGARLPVVAPALALLAAEAGKDFAAENASVSVVEPPPDPLAARGHRIASSSYGAAAGECADVTCWGRLIGRRQKRLWPAAAQDGPPPHASSVSAGARRCLQSAIQRRRMNEGCRNKRAKRGRGEGGGGDSQGIVWVPVNGLKLAVLIVGATGVQRRYSFLRAQPRLFEVLRRR